MSTDIKSDTGFIISKKLSKMALGSFFFFMTFVRGSFAFISHFFIISARVI